MGWPILRSRTAKEQNRTKQNIDRTLIMRLQVRVALANQPVTIRWVYRCHTSNLVQIYSKLWRFKQKQKGTQIQFYIYK